MCQKGVLVKEMAIYRHYNELEAVLIDTALPSCIYKCRNVKNGCKKARLRVPKVPVWANLGSHMSLWPAFWLCSMLLPPCVPQQSRIKRLEVFLDKFTPNHNAWPHLLARRTRMPVRSMSLEVPQSSIKRLCIHLKPCTLAQNRASYWPKVNLACFKKFYVLLRLHSTNSGCAYIGHSQIVL